MGLTKDFELYFKKGGFFNWTSYVPLKKIFEKNLFNMYPCVYLQNEGTQIKIIKEWKLSKPRPLGWRIQQDKKSQYKIRRNSTLFHSRQANFYLIKIVLPPLKSSKQPIFMNKKPNKKAFIPQKRWKRRMKELLLNQNTTMSSKTQSWRMKKCLIQTSQEDDQVHPSIKTPTNISITREPCTNTKEQQQRPLPWRWWIGFSRRKAQPLSDSRNAPTPPTSQVHRSATSNFARVVRTTFLLAHWAGVEATR